MIDKRSPKGFFLKVLVLHVTVHIEDLLRKEEGCYSSGPRCLASSALPLTNSAGSSAMLVLRFPIWEHQIIKRKERASDGFGIKLAYMFQSWEATTGSHHHHHHAFFWAPGPDAPLALWVCF
jgi:hypothetical protein